MYLIYLRELHFFFFFMQTRCSKKLEKCRSNRSKRELFMWATAKDRMEKSTGVPQLFSLSLSISLAFSFSICLFSRLFLFLWYFYVERATLCTFFSKKKQNARSINGRMRKRGERQKGSPASERTRDDCISEDRGRPGGGGGTGAKVRGERTSTKEHKRRWSRSIRQSRGGKGDSSMRRRERKGGKVEGGRGRRGAREGRSKCTGREKES